MSAVAESGADRQGSCALALEHLKFECRKYIWKVTRILTKFLYVEFRLNINGIEVLDIQGITK